METPTKRRHNERIIEKVLRKCEKKTYKYIKKNADKVKKLGQLLFEKKHLKSSEILSCIGQFLLADRQIAGGIKTNAKIAKNPNIAHEGIKLPY